MNTYVGAVVHYVSRSSTDLSKSCRAAWVTEVCYGDGCLHDATFEDVSLMVATPSGVFFDRHVRHDDEGEPRTWHPIGPACNQEMWV